MHAKVDQAAAARKLAIPEPAALRAKGIVKGEVGCEHLPELAGSDPLADRLRGCGMAVAEVHTEQAVGSVGGIEHGLHLRRAAAERLLAENCCPCVERLNALFSVEGAR